MLLLFLLLATSFALTDVASMQACRTMARDALLPCFSSLVDTNHDGSLNLTEITTFLNVQHVPASSVLMRLCDTNNDNVLDMTDWNAVSGCAHSQPIITRACYICVQAGWSPFGDNVPSVNKKKV